MSATGVCVGTGGDILPYLQPMFHTKICFLEFPRYGAYVACNKIEERFTRASYPSQSPSLPSLSKTVPGLLKTDERTSLPQIPYTKIDSLHLINNPSPLSPPTLPLPVMMLEALNDPDFMAASSSRSAAKAPFSIESQFLFCILT